MAERAQRQMDCAPKETCTEVLHETAHGIDVHGNQECKKTQAIVISVLAL